MLIIKPNNHQHCAVCDLPFFNDHSAIQFQVLQCGGVQGEIVATDKVQGYQGVMQGGVISTLHDTAMTHCLFNRGVSAMTAQLDVRFFRPIPLNTNVKVQAHLINSKRGVYYLRSRIIIKDKCYSKAEAKFM